jgi:hemerythrin-like domain-containing protein
MPIASLLDPNTTGAQAVSRLEREQARLLRSCRLLEAMADSLPAGFQPSKALDLLKFTEAALQQHIALQERVIFTFLRRGSAGDQVECILRQLEYEHGYDSALIIEMAEMVTVVPSSNSPDIERFGYLLRHFFEGHRRHCAWETIILNPFVKAALKQASRH